MDARYDFLKKVIFYEIVQKPTENQHFWALGAVLGRSWGDLGAILGGLGAVLGRSWAILGGLGAVLGRSLYKYVKNSLKK